MLDLAKFVDRGVSVKLSGGRQGEYWFCNAGRLISPVEC